ncbi:MAG: hypothetical protein K2N12_02735 [Helicobacter sp.]|nr:hypothetical protein [Helicobacter sp.]
MREILGNERDLPHLVILCARDSAALVALARNDVLPLLTNSNKPDHSAQRLCSSRKA